MADADDAAYATMELEGGAIALLDSSWCTRVNREGSVTFHIDGMHGSAVAGLHGCKVQAREDTPKPVWSPDNPQGMDFYSDWTEVAGGDYENGFKVQWEAFIRHVVDNAPWEYDFLSGAKGVQLVELEV